jgi:hypothetical protein
VQIGTVPCKECTGKAKSQSCNSEQSIGNTAAAGLCAESKLQHLGIVEDFAARSACKELS